MAQLWKIHLPQERSFSEISFHLENNFNHIFKKTFYFDLNLCLNKKFYLLNWTWINSQESSYYFRKCCNSIFIAQSVNFIRFTVLFNVYLIKANFYLSFSSYKIIEKYLHTFYTLIASDPLRNFCCHSIIRFPFSSIKLLFGSIFKFVRFA